MLQFIASLVSGFNCEVYIVFNIERAGREFQAGNKNHDIINVKDIHKAREQEQIMEIEPLYY